MTSQFYTVNCSKLVWLERQYLKLNKDNDAEVGVRMRIYCALQHELQQAATSDFKIRSYLNGMLALL